MAFFTAPPPPTRLIFHLCLLLLPQVQHILLLLSCQPRPEESERTTAAIVSVGTIAEKKQASTPFSLIVWVGTGEERERRRRRRKLFFRPVTQRKSSTPLRAFGRHTTQLLGRNPRTCVCVTVSYYMNESA